MRLALVSSALAVFVFLAGGAACSSDDGAGGNGSGFDKTGSCPSTCAKAAALNCSEDPAEAECVTSCEAQKAMCDAASQSDTFQTYLDCIESTPMACGSTTNTATSAQCLSQGLAILQCFGSGG